MRKIPSDGTFDQMKPVEILQKKFHTGSKRTFSSIDLSAATDRLPLILQQRLLAVLLKEVVPDSEAFAKS